jgi:hypothetical protein
MSAHECRSIDTDAAKRHWWPVGEMNVIVLIVTTFGPAATYVFVLNECMQPTHSTRDVMRPEKVEHVEGIHVEGIVHCLQSLVLRHAGHHGKCMPMRCSTTVHSLMASLEGRVLNALCWCLVL